MRKCSGLRPAWRVAATIGVVTLTATGVLTAAAKAKLTSPWRDRDIRVDGIGGEWRELQPLAKNVRWGIGLASDADHLYVALITSDALTTRQTLQEGLIVWFDAKGGKKRQFGIRYPTGMMGGPGGPRGGAQGEMGGGRGGELPPREGGQVGSPGTAADVGSMFARAEAEGRLRQLEILRDGHEDQPASIDAVAPLELRMGWREGILVYELKMPLAKSGLLPGLGVRPGAIVGLGLETPKRNNRDDGDTRGGGPGGDMGGGRGGGMGGGRGGGMPGGMGGGMPGGMGGPDGLGQNTPQALRVWTTLLLSPGPSGR